MCELQTCLHASQAVHTECAWQAMLPAGVGGWSEPRRGVNMPCHNGHNEEEMTNTIKHIQSLPHACTQLTVS